MKTFNNDEEGYLHWVKVNPTGYVINVPKEGGEYKLHRASCRDITTDKRTNYTTNDYMKVCSMDRAELVVWGTHDTDEFSECKRCKP